MNDILFHTPFTTKSKKMLLLGGGELGKEVVISAQRLGIETIVVDRYKNAPAMQVASHHYAIDMLDESALYEVIKQVNPYWIVPEIEAINTHVLHQASKEDIQVVPNAHAVSTTMDRQKIRSLAANQLNILTTKFHVADTLENFKKESLKFTMPCVVKPLMSSSGKGQSVIHSVSDLEKAWNYAHQYSRGKSTSVIIEEYLDFDYEITLLTIKHRQGISFCAPIGHIQEDGDYIESWQPHNMPQILLEKAQKIAEQITTKLGGYGVFGVELFIKDNEVYFNEVSPRPHDTGMVTMISQSLSQFDLHVRAIVGLPIPQSINTLKPSASYALLMQGETNEPVFSGVT